MNVTIKRKSPYGLVSLTLGIISVLSALFWYISFPTGILAIIFGNTGKKMVDSNIALAGKIVGIIGLCISGIIFSLFLAFYIFATLVG